MQQTSTERVQGLIMTGWEKVILWELCKGLEFDLINKWYMHKPESILENDIHKNILDFVRLNPSQKARPRRKKERTCHLVNFGVAANHRVKKKEKEKIKKYLDLARELKKLWNLNGDCNINNWKGGSRNWKSDGKSRPYRSVDIGLNTETKRPINQ